FLLVLKFLPCELKMIVFFLFVGSFLWPCPTYVCDELHFCCLYRRNKYTSKKENNQQQCQWVVFKLVKQWRITIINGLDYFTSNLNRNWGVFLFKLSN